MLWGHRPHSRLLDWETAELGRDLEQHDIVIASRSVGLQDLRKLSSFARRIAVIMAWANAHSIPNILHDIFVGCSEEEERRGPFPMDRRVGYNVTYNMVYDMGYDPNVRILTDGFTRDFSCREEAYAEMVSLGTVAPGKMDVYRANLDRFLTRIPTAALPSAGRPAPLLCGGRPIKAKCTDYNILLLSKNSGSRRCFYV